jgi:hypothetical protein
MRCALLAVSAGKLGWLKKDSALSKRGMELYGRTLAKVTASLENLENVDRTELTGTCRLLALYEVDVIALFTGSR